MIKAIIFDIDGTLVDHKHAQKYGLLSFYNDHLIRKIDSFDVFEQVWIQSVSPFFERYKKGGITFEELRSERMQYVLGKFNIIVSKNEALNLFFEYLSYYEKNYVLYSDVLQCLKSLKGYKLGIISNGDSTMQRNKLRLTKITDYFDSVVISEDIQVAKPHAEIFLKAIEELCVMPKESVYIGDDHGSDIVGASSVGLKTIFLRRYNEPHSSIASLNVSSLDNLSNCIKRL